MILQADDETTRLYLYHLSGSVAANNEFLASHMAAASILPCGNGLELRKINVQTQSIPCPCGDPRHWLLYVAGELTP
jgi:hypothetical protein